jgi:hypothetical protein
MTLKTVSLSEKLSFIDLAIKALALCPQATGELTESEDLVSRIVHVANLIADRIEQPN